QTTCLGLPARRGGLATDDPPLATPDNGLAAPVHPDLAIDGGDMVANGVAGQLQGGADLGIRHAGADQAQHFTFTRGQVAELGVLMTRACRPAYLRQLFEQAAAEPRGVLHDGLDGRGQLALGLLVVADVLYDGQHTTLARDKHAFGLDQAVQHGTMPGPQLEFLFADTVGRIQQVYEPAIRLRIGP